MEGSRLAAPRADSRLRWIDGGSSAGGATGLDLAMSASEAPYVAFVQPGDRLLRGALRKVVEVLEKDPSTALVHCWWFEVDRLGRAGKLTLRRREQALRVQLPASTDHRLVLVERGNVIQTLPTYRREALAKLPGFEETGGHDPAYTMALRLLDDWKIRIVPELLCCREGPVDSGLGWRRRLTASMREAAIRGRRRLRLFTYSNLASLVVHGFGRSRYYHGVVDVLSWWPIELRRRRRSVPPDRDGRLAYVLWHYPTLSETFIQREIGALQRSGLDVEVFADASDSSWPNAEPDPPGRVYHLDPSNHELQERFRRSFRRRMPLKYLNLFVYVVSRRYVRRKTLWGDLRFFRKAVYLAGWLEQRGATHVHAPWADSHGFLALVAARLLGVSYSVQARAHEIHSRSSNLALRENVRNARFVVTNSRFNEAFIRPILGRSADEHLHIIYNGLDLARLPLPAQAERGSRELRILSVGRLVEQKGFDNLLRACRILADRGVKFSCDVIGGPDWSQDANTYVSLKKLRRTLALEDIVSFLGPQPTSRVFEAYVAADIFALPCVVAEDGGRDVTPNVLLEAMAYRLPVISTPVGAIPEIVEHGTDGILVRANDPDSLAAGLMRLMESPELRRTLGEAAREKIERRFNSDRSVQQYVRLFRSVGVA